jgi:hypothetical protein
MPVLNDAHRHTILPLLNGKSGVPVQQDVLCSGNFAGILSTAPRQRVTEDEYGRGGSIFRR